jgi:TRAP-type C4-dicarboxylate transport system substrate-binding protein
MGATRAGCAPLRRSRAVAAHDADLGYVHAGVLDTFGVTSLQALSAPMLMRSYAVEREVLNSDMAPVMLAGVERAGVKGLALLGDEMRRPFGAGGALRGPADYRGVTVAAYPSNVTDAALEALGARPSHLYGTRLDDAIEHRAVGGLAWTLRSYVNNQTPPLAPYGTANVVLWPQVLALIANPATLSRLDGEQRRWLAQAAAEAAGTSIERGREAERNALTAACRAGGRFSRADAADVSALKARFRRMYAMLDEDPPTRGFISRIRDLDAATPPDAALDVPSGCDGRPPSPPKFSDTAARRFEGTWRWRLTEQDRRKDLSAGGDTRSGDDVFTVTIRDGRWHLHVDGADGTIEDDFGTVTLDSGELAFAWDRGGTVDRFGYRLDGDVLRLTGTGGDPGDLFVWGTEPWRRIG